MALTLRTARPITGLRPSPVFGYVRKSTEDSDRQIMSLQQQRERIEQFVVERGWGRVDLWFSDEQSGKNFDRPGFQKLLATCAANVQRGEPGRIIALDYDRFARPVNKRIKVDDIEYQRQRIALHDSGYELDYALTPKSGNTTQDALMGAMKVVMSGEYIEKLSIRSRDGKKRAGVNGYWTGGMAPFPAARYDARSGRRLDKGERANNGQAILGPPADATLVQHWIDGAHMILAGHALDAVGQEFNARGVPSYYQDRQRDGLCRAPWRHSSLAPVFTNVALIGRVEYQFTREDGSIEIFEGPAQWEPIVPVDLFRAVRAEIEKRRQQHRRARPNRDYPLGGILECYNCGARYVANTFSIRWGKANGTKLRGYVHPVGVRMNQMQQKKTAKCHCRSWSFHAEEIENAVRDLIIEHRGSKDFARTFADLITEQGALDAQSEQMEKDAERQVKMIEKKRNNLRDQLEDAEDAETREYLLARVTELTRELRDAQNVWKQARARREQSSELDDELLRLVEQARTIRSAWSTSGDEGIERRRAIIDTWVEKVLVEIIEAPGASKRARKQQRRVYVFLRTAPHTPLTLDVNMRKDGPRPRSVGSHDDPLAPQCYVLTIGS